MNSNPLQYVKLTPCDEDIPYLLEVHRRPDISRFISIEDHGYFHYVTSTDHVGYYKVLHQNRIAATIHVETQAETLYLSILTLPEYQNRGIATQILKDIKSKKLVRDFSKIQVSIDKDNISSIKLFEKAGFVLSREEENLLEYDLPV